MNVDLRELGRLSTTQRDRAVRDLDVGWVEVGDDGELRHGGSDLAHDVLVRGWEEPGARADALVRGRLLKGRISPTPAELAAFRTATARSPASPIVRQRFIEQVESWLGEINQGDRDATSPALAQLGTGGEAFGSRVFTGLADVTGYTFLNSAVRGFFGSGAAALKKGAEEAAKSIAVTVGVVVALVLLVALGAFLVPRALAAQAAKTAKGA